jgi:hypothetical protein
MEVLEYTKREQHSLAVRLYVVCRMRCHITQKLSITVLSFINSLWPNIQLNSIYKFNEGFLGDQPCKCDAGV